MVLFFVTGRLSARTLRWLAAAGLAFLSLRLFAGGKPLVAIVPLLAALALLWTRNRLAQPKIKTTPRADESALARARALLEIGPEADAEAVRAAHRRLMERVHPDKGGSAALAAQVNEARDILLAALADGAKDPAQ